MSINSRLKGKRGELELISIIREHGWPNASRTSDGRAQSQRGDVRNGPAGCHFECKLVERLNVPGAFDQLVRDCGPVDLPVLVHRPSRHPWMATLELTELLALLRLRERA